ncbi:serine carboxypeptidase-like 13 isoform X4 [Helianthus annuus]|uniref:serine carboxypeptidase-like 13 isoform X4 n=1 Tax=Helianthus annuus TaxID=4232 RepID=UPI000B8FCF98|nr:serine carboxypeptidase-like 13 isoform X4 [Helianthus annuus]
MQTLILAIIAVVKLQKLKGTHNILHIEAMRKYVIFLLTIQSCLIIKSYSESVIRRLPGYSKDLPFKLETGYIGVGEKEDVQLFYYLVESTRNPKEDPLIFFIPGGPGASALVTFLYEIGPLNFNLDDDLNNLTLTLNPNAWTQMANIIFVDIPAGTGFSYSETKEGWISSNSILAIQAVDFIKKSAVNSCHGNYVDINSANSACLNSLQSYEECTSHINLENILEPFCDENDPALDCETDFNKVITKWANTKVVQQALNIRQGTIGKWELINNTLHYHQGKNDTLCYSYDIFTSFSHHKELSSKKCRALIMSGDHDLTFPYVGVEQWITSLNVQVEVPWKPFYIDGQVGGYITKYAQNDYSLTFATVKGAGHTIPHDKPRQTMVLTQEWFSSQTYSSDS